MINLLEILLTKVTDVIGMLGYWGVAIGMALESANIPIPSEVILTFGGYLVSIGKLEFYRTVLAGLAGGMAGSIASYWLGVWGGRPVLAKYGRYVGFSMKHLDLAERWFDKYGELTVCFSRMLPVIRTFISLPAGIAKMNFVKFCAYSLLGSLPWSFLMVYIGLKLGQNWQSIEVWFHRADVLVLAWLIAILLLYLYKRKSN